MLLKIFINNLQIASIKLNYFFFLIKNIFDKLLSLIFLVILCPLMLFLAIIIFFIDKQSPLFIQERSGIYGKKIFILKFKTMKTINNKIYVTSIGKILRKSKLDETPQLLNILLGNISFVGPRPLYLDFNNYYSDIHKKRLSVKPGLTGLAQIKVMDNADWKKKFNFDCIYVNKMSIMFDLFIIFKTFIYFLNLFTKKKGKEHIEIYDYKENFFKFYVKNYTENK